MKTLLTLTLAALVAAPTLSAQHRDRCGTPERLPGGPGAASPSDCGYWTNSPQPQYEPTFFYDIPVVFHVIQDSSGDGFLSEATIREQIDVLNEDFQAIAGSLGAPGTNAMIRFHLATSDPQGLPTNGITYSTNNTWFQDNGDYWNSLAWDTNRYLNIYTNAVPCCYGYVADFPQTGIVGTNEDRVVLWFDAVGRQPTQGWPENRGRTATHEVGHYLGLYHTFDSGCGSSSNCYGTGDLICDTNGQRNPTYGCPGSANSCGDPDPFHNYMDYSDDLCMWEFTPEQVNRMRCILENWRPNVWRTYAAQEVVRLGSPPNPAVLLPGESGPPAAGLAWDPKVDHTSFVPNATVDVLAISLRSVNIDLGTQGTLLAEQPFLVTVWNNAPGTPFSLELPANFGLIGQAFTAQAASRDGSGLWQLTNALDCVIGN